MITRTRLSALLCIVLGLVAAGCGSSSDDLPLPLSQRGAPPQARVAEVIVAYDTDGTGVQTVELDGSSSFDTDGSISSWRWVSGLSLLAEGEVVDAEFTRGNHVLSLVVEDDTGLVDSQVVLVAVLAPDVRLDPGAPVIEIWGSDNWPSATTAVAQRFVNILGTATDPDGIESVVYRLNDRPSETLTVGPDGRRLARAGDFNVEIPRGQLSVGENVVEITATDGSGSSSTRVVILDYSPEAGLGLPFAADWSAASSVTDLASPVDGDWRLGTGSVVLSRSAAGYDRMLALGDQRWSSYEVSTTIQVTSITDEIGPLSEQPGIGIYLGWNGHTLRRGVASQPLTGIESSVAGEPTFGSLGILRFHGDDEVAFETRNHLDQIDSTSPVSVDLGSTYDFVARVQPLGDSSVEYSYWVWPVGTGQPAEPTARLVVEQDDLSAPAGSVAIVANELAAIVGPVEVVQR